jgi:RNA polymerase sigma-70 factor, ECF subfamily
MPAQKGCQVAIFSVNKSGGQAVSRMMAYVDGIRAMPLPVRVEEDSALVAEARRGDRTAFGRLYERFAPMVHGILLARVPRCDAEDLLQDVFVSALRRLETLRDDGAFGGWLASIARNRARDHYRIHVNRTELSEDIIAAPSTTENRALTVLAAIRHLPEAYRETLILRLVEGMTGDEIASRTGLTPASVRVNLHRGMKQLREFLSKEGLP